MPSSKAAEVIAASLHRLFGAEVETRYFDVSDPAIAAAHADLLDQLAIERIPLPAVLLDGELLFSGAIEPLWVVAAVAEAHSQR
jgi:hypothetical protein